MPDFRVPIGCTGLDMEGGSRYGASRSGRVTVDDPRDIAHISRVGRSNGWMIHPVPHTGPQGGASRVCPACAFVGYGWQRQCPRGHGEMPLGVPGRKAPGAAEAGAA